ncbi:MAG: hypothetical protein AAF548_09500 [Actinomycetota bacterium]
MWWTELRGALAVALVIGGIAFAWTRIESRPVKDIDLTATTTTTTTTTLPPTTTLDLDARNAAICDLARDLEAQVATLPDPGPGPVARLALEFWREVEPLSDPGVAAEVSAVVTYYEDYLETAAPFDFDTSKIIVEGDKEKLQQLLTRPAPGLDESRTLVAFFCGVSVPDKPSMSATAFDDLEDRLLDPDDDS